MRTLRIYFTAILGLLIPFMGHSQSIYDALRFSNNDYEGTARGVAMGNAFTALGGDMGAITINPAQSTGIGDRVGSLEPGKDGDVVIWTADPLTTIGGEAFATVVNGKVVYQA